MLNEKNKALLCHVLLLLCAVPLFFLNIHGSHPLGDDFAQYIKEAENICKGKPYYLFSYVYNSADFEYAPPQYPPGLPLLLAPVVAISGIAIRPLIYLNSFLVAALLFTLFAYFKKRMTVVPAFCLSLIVIYSGLILAAKGEIMSDMPCLLFIMLYLTVRDSPVFSRRRITSLILLAAMAVLIRSQAVLLLGAEGLFFILEIVRSIRAKRFEPAIFFQHVSVKVVAGAMVTLVIVYVFIFPSPASTTAFYLSLFAHRNGALLDMFTDNIHYLFFIFTRFLSFPDMFRPLHPVAAIMEHFSVCATFAGFLLLIKKRVRVDDLFFMLVCLMVIIFLEREARYLTCVFPLFVFYVYYFITAISGSADSKVARMIIPLFTILYLVMGARTYAAYSHERCEGCVPSPVISAFVDPIKARVNDSDVIVFPKPRLLALYTGKRAVIYARHLPDADNKQKLHELGVKYFLPWYDKDLLAFMRRNYAVIDSQVLGEAVLYRVE